MVCQSCSEVVTLFSFSVQLSNKQGLGTGLNPFFVHEILKETVNSSFQPHGRESSLHSMQGSKKRRREMGRQDLSL